MAEFDFSPQFQETSLSFDISFEEFIALYRGVERVWIGNGTDGENGVLYAEMVDGVVQTLGPVTGYYYALEQGFTGTFSEWVQIILDCTVNAQAAAASAAAALASQTAAAGSETNASTYASSAEASATNASTSEANASLSSLTASTKASEASSSASTASTKASEASTSASNAATSEANAAASALLASDKASEASSSALSAANSASSAETKASEASTSASNAATSESNALSYKNAAQNAQTGAEEAKENAEAWAIGKRNGSDVPTTDPTYQNNAKYYSTQASSFATTAFDSATNASTYATNAANSASGALTSEGNALTYSNNALAYKNDAEQAKTDAQTSESNASASAAISSSKSLDSEAYAIGKRNGIDVGSSDVAYHNNALYYSQQAREIADEIKAATSITEYQNSTSGSTIPTGTWTPNPDPQSGKYLWARTTLTWTDTSTSVIYGVNYIGVNGTGSVDSVNGMSGNVVLDGNNIYIDNSATTKKTIYTAINELSTPISNSEIDTLFA